MYDNDVSCIYNSLWPYTSVKC